MGEGQTAAGAASRRGLLLGAGAAGAAAVLAGCGGSGDGDGPPGPHAAGTGRSTGGASAPTGEAAAVIARTSDIPLGGGKIFADRRVVITQPAAGMFRGFSSTCTHLSCTVESVSGGTINCACHGSMYAIADGAVRGGPAPRPLPAKEIEVAGDEISLT
jgi:nitrite reductase/ring-hydroxylating ferredoxin subunit